MMVAAKCTIVTLLHNSGNGSRNERRVVLVAVKPLQYQGGQQFKRRRAKGQFGAKSCVHYLLVDKWPFWTGRDPYPTPFYGPIL